MAFTLAVRLAQRNFTKSSLNVPLAAFGTHGGIHRDAVHPQKSRVSQFETPYTLADIGCKNKVETFRRRQGPPPTPSLKNRY
ncbi:hypothetical protein BSL78_22781 [Apostichopus japonicus]|uniref:Uncharacterized protein n=1 Tax=Stichopus japonicus TaxID=307972 RepID=A0A2G8JXE2_STIJA|nr:hypothetical protein BSL78_22781 [Apostichopus japonicus]